MYRIDKKIDEILETLRYHSVEHHDLKADIQAKAYKLIENFEEESLDEAKNIQKAEKLLPVHILTSFGINPIDEPLWLRLFFYFAIATICALEYFYVGRGQIFLLSFFCFVLIFEPIGYSINKFLPARLGGGIYKNGFRIGLKKGLWNDVEEINYSKFSGASIKMINGKKVKLGSPSVKNIYFLKRFISNLEKKINIPDKLNHAIAKKDLSFNPLRQNHYLRIILIICITLMGLHIWHLAYYLLYNDYLPLLLIIPSIVLGTILVAIIAKTNKSFLMPYLSIFNSIFFTGSAPIIYLVLFRDGVYFTSIITIFSTVLFFLAIRAFTPPFLEKKKFLISALAMILFVLTSMAFERYYIERNIEEIAVIPNSTITMEMLNIDDQTLICNSISLSLYPFSKPRGEALSKIKIEDGSVSSMEITGERARIFMTSLSPDGNLLLSSVKHNEEEHIYLTDIRSFEHDMISNDPEAMVWGAPSYILSDPWNPPSKGFTVSELGEKEKSWFYYDLSSGNMTKISKGKKPYFVYWNNKGESVWCGKISKTKEKKDNVFFTKGQGGGEFNVMVDFGDTYRIYRRNFRDRIVITKTEDGRLSVFDIRHNRQFPLSFSMADMGAKGFDSYITKVGDNKIALALQSCNKNEPCSDISGFAVIDYHADAFNKILFEESVETNVWQVSPDGKYFVYTKEYGNEGKIKFFMGSRLFIADMKNKSTRKIYDMNFHLSGFNNQVQWSKDSKYVFASSAMFPSILDNSYKNRIVKIKVANE